MNDRISLLLVVLLAGCGGANAKPEMPGYYVLTHATMGGEREPGTGGGYLILREDGTFKMVQMMGEGIDPKGVWEREGDNRFILRYANGRVINAKMKIDDDHLTLSWDYHGLKFVRKYERRDLAEEPTEKVRGPAYPSQ